MTDILLLLAAAASIAALAFLIGKFIPSAKHGLIRPIGAIMFAWIALTIAAAIADKAGLLPIHPSERFEGDFLVVLGAAAICLIVAVTAYWLAKGRTLVTGVDREQFRRFGLRGVIVVLIAVGGPKLYKAYFSDPNAANATPQEVIVEDHSKAFLSQQHNKIFVAIKEVFPEDFTDLLATLASELNKPGGAARAFELGGLATTKIKRKYAHLARSAPDDALKEVVRRKLRQIVLFSEDPAECARIMAIGPGALTEAQLKPFVGELDIEGATLIRALGKGAKSGAAPKIPTNEDWDNVLENWFASGATGADAQSISKPTPNDENLCPAFSTFLKTILDAKGLSGERVRAEYVVGVASE